MARGRRGGLAQHIGATTNTGNWPSKHFHDGILWPDVIGDWQHCLSLNHEPKPPDAKEALKAFLVQCLSLVPEYLAQRFEKRDRDNVTRGIPEERVFQLVLSRDVRQRRLIRTPYADLSEEERRQLTSTHYWCRYMWVLYEALSANNQTRQQRGQVGVLLNELPDLLPAFRARSSNWERFRASYGGIADFDAPPNGAASDRHWQVINSLVVFTNKHFTTNGFWDLKNANKSRELRGIVADFERQYEPQPVAELPDRVLVVRLVRRPDVTLRLKLRSDGTFELAKGSKLHPLEAALDTYAQAHAGGPLPSDQSRNLSVDQDDVTERLQELEAEIEALRRELEDQKEASRHLAARYEEREESLNEERAYFDKVRASFQEDLEIQSDYGEYLLEEGSLTPDRAPQLHEAMALAMLRLTGKLPREPLLQDE